MEELTNEGNEQKELPKEGIGIHYGVIDDCINIPISWSNSKRTDGLAPGLCDYYGNRCRWCCY